ncbi:MAG TPA: MBL fold metallo-hydrolase [Thermodesulfovibrionales bacterium]|nr:MBL fold metallo-hydrolase [Thermodesulfovibrionales bacterium]
MKKAGSVGAWFCLILSIFVLFGQRVYAEGGLTKIADNVYSYLDVKGATPQNSFGANAGIIIGKDGIVVVDTLISAKEAKRFIQDIRKVSDKPIRYVINTHYHLDHSFGNSEFEKLGAIIISHAADKMNLVTNGEGTLKNAKAYGLTEDDMAGTKIVYPSLSFADRLQIDLGDQKVDLIFTGPSHTGGSIVVHLPDRRILFTGDILFAEYHPYMADGNIEGWTRTLDAIMSLDVLTIIPGHGPISGKHDIREMKDYIVAFDKMAKELTARSQDIEYIVAEMKKSLPERSELDFAIKANIQMKYLKKEK